MQIVTVLCSLSSDKRTNKFPSFSSNEIPFSLYNSGRCSLSEQCLCAKYTSSVLTIKLHFSGLNLLPWSTNYSSDPLSHLLYLLFLIPSYFIKRFYNNSSKGLNFIIAHFTLNIITWINLTVNLKFLHFATLLALQSNSAKILSAFELLDGSNFRPSVFKVVILVAHNELSWEKPYSHHIVLRGYDTIKICWWNFFKFPWVVHYSICKNQV